jgi:hypothetical protein
MCRVHLLEHLVDVDGVGLAPLLLAIPALVALSLGIFSSTLKLVLDLLCSPSGAYRRRSLSASSFLPHAWRNTLPINTAFSYH